MVKTLFIIILSCISLTAIAIPKDTIPLDKFSEYNFKNSTENIIKDKKNELYPLFKRLYKIRQLNSTNNVDTFLTASLIHFGDSHIQADIISGRIRYLLQKDFGNAGRGLITPLRLTATNEARTYRIRSDTPWEFSRIMKPKMHPIGIGGVELHRTEPIAKVSLETINEEYAQEWTFNHITAFYDRTKAKISLADESFMISRFEESNYTEHFFLSGKVNNVDFVFHSGEMDIRMYAFNLSNSQNGLYYHSIGINGAKFSDYIDHDLLCEQTKYLNPQVFVISLGTNEAYGAKILDKDSFYAYISDFIFNLRKQSPEATVILTTPPEVFRRYARGKRGPNAVTQDVRDVIVDYAEKNGYPYWDLYVITGGKNSALEWNRNKLLQKDGIHFTKTGYDMQGEMFYSAIIKQYNSYIQSLELHKP